MYCPPRCHNANSTFLQCHLNVFVTSSSPSPSWWCEYHLLIVCARFCCDVWHVELQEYQAAQSGPRKQIQHLFVAVSFFSPALEDRVSLLLLYELSTQLRIFCWHKRVFVCAPVCVCVCIYGCVYLSASVCLPAFAEGVQTGTSEFVAVTLRCQYLWHIVSFTCELFLLQTSVLDICYLIFAIQSHGIIERS